MVSLRVGASSSPYSERINVFTKRQSKIFLKVADNPKQGNTKQVGSSSSKKFSTTYDVVNQLTLPLKYLFLSY